MNIPLSSSNILKAEFEALLFKECWSELLLSGDFYTFEKLLYQKMLDLYDQVVESIVGTVSQSDLFISAQRQRAEDFGLKKLEVRDSSVRLRTGTLINHASLYAKNAPLDYGGSRHLSMLLWQTEQNCSPVYKSITCLHSVLCPSFEVAKELLNYQGIHANEDKVRAVSLGLADACMVERSSVQLAAGESLKGTDVVIAVDGGRSRTRVYGPDGAGRSERYGTPWREPKMFVITTCDGQGRLNKARLPIYDATFGDDETFALLKAYLENLQVDRAESVQFLADGAPWIWNRAKPLLLSLGVAEDKIIETLDYYHAAEHVNDMEVYFDEDKKGSHFDRLKEALWQGDFTEMTKLVQQGIQGVDLEDFNPFKYFEKQQNRIGYQRLRNENRPCGSGIIESGIRRIINLRFKSPSTFWYPENVERLIFMRGVALSGRWEIMMNNRFCS